MTARSLLAAALATLLAACGSSPPSSTMSTARMNVHLVDSPATDYWKVTLFVKSVEIASDSGWITLGTVNESVNLLDLQNGVFKTLALGAELPPGHYGQMRLILGTPNTVTLADKTTTVPLTIPSGSQTGVKFPVSFDLQAGTTYEIFIDILANKSVFVHRAGASNKYMLRPVVRAYDRMMTGSISGVLTNASAPAGTPNGLGGVEVIAQTVGTDGQPSFAASTTTNPDGTYKLGLLPVNKTYFVASLPVVSVQYADTTTSYLPKASAAIPINASTPTATWTETFTAVDLAKTGTVSGAISPPPAVAQGDTAEARLQVAAGTGGSLTKLIVRTTSGEVTTNLLGNPVSESYSFAYLPASTYLPSSPEYGFAAERIVPDPVTGVEKTIVSNENAKAVPEGGSVTADITFPQGPAGAAADLPFP